MSTYLLSSKNIETQCIQKSKKCTAMFTKYACPSCPLYTSLLVSVCMGYSYLYIYIDQNIFTHKKRNQESLSFFTLTSPARMVAISPCMKAHGTLEPTRGHFSPLGQYTSPVAPCCLMLSREQGKQNLWDATEGHCTKCVSSSLSWQSVQHSGMLLGTEESGMLCECTGSMPGTWGITAPCASRRWLGESGLLLFLRVVECTWLPSLGELFPPALSAARMSAAIGELPFWPEASGGVLRGWGDIVEGGEEKLGGGTGGIFNPSPAGSHCCPSPLILAAVPPSPSDSGDFLFRFLGCLPRSAKKAGACINYKSSHYYTALFTMQIVSKLLYSIKHGNSVSFLLWSDAQSVFMKRWQCGRCSKAM